MSVWYLCVNTHHDPDIDFHLFKFAEVYILENPLPPPPPRGGEYQPMSFEGKNMKKYEKTKRKGGKCKRKGRKGKENEKTVSRRIK
jgi:hypothetical protein